MTVLQVTKMSQHDEKRRSESNTFEAVKTVHLAKLSHTYVVVVRETVAHMDSFL